MSVIVTSADLFGALEDAVRLVLGDGPSDYEIQIGTQIPRCLTGKVVVGLVGSCPRASAFVVFRGRASGEPHSQFHLFGGPTDDGVTHPVLPLSDGLTSVSPAVAGVLRWRLSDDEGES